MPDPHINLNLIFINFQDCAVDFEFLFVLVVFMNYDLVFDQRNKIFMLGQDIERAFVIVRGDSLDAALK